MSELKVQNLRRTFGSVVALEDMSFDVHEGEFFCLLGPSSSGKTTTLRSIAGLEQLDKGKVHFAGQNVTNAPVQGRGMSMIFPVYGTPEISWCPTNVSRYSRCKLDAARRHTMGLSRYN